MPDFVYNAMPGRVVFRVGASADIGDELERLGSARTMITTSRGNRATSEGVAAGLGPRCMGLYEDAKAHVPVEQAEAASQWAREHDVDSVVSIGGGSPIGLAKAIAHETGIPIIAVPTTYSGSEMTGLVGVTRDGVKRTVAGPAILPKTVIYDPALTYAVPPGATATTGMNAIAHCVEALYVPAANPVSSLLAEAGLSALIRGLPAAVRDGEDAEARGLALYGAYLAGAALGATGIALHHKVCHALGGSFGVAHGDANAIILPQAVAFNAAAARVPIAAAARAMGASDNASDDAAASTAAPFLFDFVANMGAPTSLESVGLDHGALDDAARIAMELINDNPRPVDYQGVRALLEDAWVGQRPGIV